MEADFQRIKLLAEAAEPGQSITVWLSQRMPYTEVWGVVKKLRHLGYLICPIGEQEDGWFKFQRNPEGRVGLVLTARPSEVPISTEVIVEVDPLRPSWRDLVEKGDDS